MTAKLKKNIKECPKCKRTLYTYNFGFRKIKKWVKKENIYRTYYYLQSYCNRCRH